MESEDTLKMITDALNSGASVVAAAPAGKKKKTVAKKKTKPKETPDFKTRVLNDYGDNPHL